MYHLQLHGRYHACVVAHRGHIEVTPDIDLDFMKYKGSLILGSAYILTNENRISINCTVNFVSISELLHTANLVNTCLP